MVKISRYNVKSINFGPKYSPTSVWVEDYIKANGKNQLSKLVRYLVEVFSNNKMESKEFKIKMLQLERKRIGKRIVEAVEYKQKIEEDLIKVGGKIEDVYN